MIATTQQPKHDILLLTGHYLPGYKAGGPVRSIANLVEALGEEFHFRIVTSDRDLGDTAAYPNVSPNQWMPVGRAQVMYLPPGLHGSLRMYALLRTVNGNTVLYLNSFFSRRFSMMAVAMRRLGLCRPRCIVLAPCGQFAAGALGLKGLRKSLFLWIARRSRIYDDILWQASSDIEAVDIRGTFPSVAAHGSADRHTDNCLGEPRRSKGAVAVASDVPGSVSPSRSNRKRKGAGQLRVVFLSRLCRMKNLEGALEILKGILGDVLFDIYGPAEDKEYWEECKREIATLPASVKVHYWGLAKHDDVRHIFMEHDLLLLPTRGENFGHVIYEALASGCPVLISDRTPWRNLESAGVGWDIPLSDLDRFRAVLQQCIESDDEWHAAISGRAMEYAAKLLQSSYIVDKNRCLFERAYHWADS